MSLTRQARPFRRCWRRRASRPAERPAEAGRHEAGSSTDGVARRLEREDRAARSPRQTARPGSAHRRAPGAQAVDGRAPAPYRCGGGRRAAFLAAMSGSKINEPRTLLARGLGVDRRADGVDRARADRMGATPTAPARSAMIEPIIEERPFMRPEPRPATVPVSTADSTSTAADIAAACPGISDARGPVVTDSPPPAFVPRTVDERALVEEALGRYRRAYNRLDARSAQAVYPAVNAPALARAFDGLESQSLQFDECEIDVRGGSATSPAAARRGMSRRSAAATRTSSPARGTSRSLKIRATGRSKTRGTITPTKTAARGSERSVSGVCPLSSQRVIQTNKGVIGALRPPLVSGMLTFAARIHVLDRFHLNPGTNVRICTSSQSGASRSVWTPAMAGFGADTWTMWPGCRCCGRAVRR